MTQTSINKMEQNSNIQNELRSRLGTVLKEARAKAGVTIEAVAHETKISKHFIVSLESGHFEDLPGQVFGRGFIKNIARYLRSDTRELLQLYDDCWDTEIRKVATNPAAIKTSEASSESTKVKHPSQIQADAAPSIATSLPRTSDIPDIKHLPSVSPPRRALRLNVPTWFVRGLISQTTLLTVLASIAAVMVIGVFGRWVSANMSRTNPVTVAAPDTSATRSAQTQSDQQKVESAVDGTEFAVAPGSSDIAVPSNVVDKVLDPTATRVDTSTSAGTLTQDSSIPAAADPEASVLAVAEKDVTPLARSSTDSASSESPLSVVGTPVAFEQTLEIKVNSPVDLKLIVDGKRMERQTYQVGVTQLNFQDRAEIFIQDASAVEISFNGKSLGVLGHKGRKRKILFQAKPSDSDFPY